MQAYAHAHIPSQLTFRAGNSSHRHTLQALLCSTLTAAPSLQKWSVTPRGLLLEAIKDRGLMCCKRALVDADCLSEGTSSKITNFDLAIGRQTECGNSRPCYLRSGFHGAGCLGAPSVEAPASSQYGWRLTITAKGPKD